MKFISFLVLVSHLGLAQQSQPCVNKDMSNDFPPNKNQLKTSWCTYITATELMNHALSREGDESLAVFDVALSAMTTKPESLKKIAERTSGFYMLPALKNYISFLDKKQKLTYGQSFVERSGAIATNILAYNVRGGACTTKMITSDDGDSSTKKHKSLAFSIDESVQEFIDSFGDQPPMPVIAIGLDLRCDNQPNWMNRFEKLRREINEATIYRPELNTGQAS